MNKRFRQIINTYYILLLINFFLCCSDANDVASSENYDDGSCFREYNGDCAGEEAGSIVEDMELGTLLDADSASESCDYLASHTSDNDKLGCLDSITLPLLDSEDPSVWCAQAETLNLTLEGGQANECHATGLVSVTGKRQKCHALTEVICRGSTAEWC